MTREGDRADVSPGALDTPSGPETARAPRVLAIVKDLFFVARIGETARLAGVPLDFAKTTDGLAGALASPPRFAIVDLTGGFDYEQVFSMLAAHRLPVLGFTTHALARQTQPWHSRCDRVVTKETLTAELPALLRDGVPPREGAAR
jgi:hypothetical protein